MRIGIIKRARRGAACSHFKMRHETRSVMLINTKLLLPILIQFESVSFRIENKLPRRRSQPIAADRSRGKREVNIGNGCGRGARRPAERKRTESESHCYPNHYYCYYVKFSHFAIEQLRRRFVIIFKVHFLTQSTSI